MRSTKKIAFGGGCHWCTEAVFQSLKGVIKVEQGWIASTGINNTFSEAVVVYFKQEEISIKKLIEIHLFTHKSSSNHSMRNKYRSGVYVFSKKQSIEVKIIINNFQELFEKRLITQVFPFENFKPSREQILNYYFKNPEKPFCKSFIDPKLKLLLNKFSKQVNFRKLNHLIEY